MDAPCVRRARALRAGAARGATSDGTVLTEMMAAATAAATAGRHALRWARCRRSRCTLLQRKAAFDLHTSARGSASRPTPVPVSV
jgi:hypothetical protein